MLLQAYSYLFSIGALFALLHASHCCSIVILLRTVAPFAMFFALLFHWCRFSACDAARTVVHFAMLLHACSSSFGAVTPFALFVCSHSCSFHDFETWAPVLHSLAPVAPSVLFLFSRYCFLALLLFRTVVFFRSGVPLVQILNSRCGSCALFLFSRCCFLALPSSPYCSFCDITPFALFLSCAVVPFAVLVHWRRCYTPDVDPCVLLLFRVVAFFGLLRSLRCCCIRHFASFAPLPLSRADNSLIHNIHNTYNT